MNYNKKYMKKTIQKKKCILEKPFWKQMYRNKILIRIQIYEKKES